MNTARLDAYLTAGPPENLAWEAWAGTVQPGASCEVIGRHLGTVDDDDGNTRTEMGGNVHGEITAIDGDTVTVKGADGLTYHLDWSDVGPVTGY